MSDVAPQDLEGYEEVLHDQSLVVALASADVAAEVFDYFRARNTLPAGEEAGVSEDLANLLRPVLQRLAFKAYTLGIDRGQAIGLREGQAQAQAGQ